MRRDPLSAVYAVSHYATVGERHFEQGYNTSCIQFWLPCAVARCTDRGVTPMPGRLISSMNANSLLGDRPSFAKYRNAKAARLWTTHGI